MTERLVAPFMQARQVASEKPASISIAVGAENANVRTVVGQILDANGAPTVGKKRVAVRVWASAAQAALATGGSTGIAVATGTILIATHTAKLVFEVLSSSDGIVNLTWTDTGTESVAVEMQVGEVYAITAAFANT